ncbi:MAG: GxxExxY protein [Ignavibacteria bacterium]|jgi:GxxExxY protein
MEKYSKDNYPLQEETFQIIGICMEIHRILGKGLLEIVYKDALEYELKNKNILYEREKKYDIQYKEIILSHNFYADFVIMDKIIVEIKAQKNLAEEHFNQVLNYLAISKCKVGLIINFGESSLKYKRVIL